MLSKTDTQKFCQEMTREHDRDRYLLTLFAPAEKQRGLWALLAFNQEIARIRESVSEPMLGEIRLQWWADVLDEITEGTVRDHPVVQELAYAVQQKPVCKVFLSETLEARRHDILYEGTVSFEALKIYTGGTGGALFRALAAFTYETPEENTREVADLLGQAWAMLGLIRAIPHYWRTGDSPLHSDAKLAMQMPNAEESWELLKPIATEMLDFVDSRLAEAIKAGDRLLTSEKSVLLPIILINLYKRSLTKVGGNPFRLVGEETSDIRKITALIWARSTGRYKLI